MRKFGLIGFPISHSLSKKFFSEKFEKEGIEDAQYELYPIKTIEELPLLIKATPNLVGLNITIPYKQQVIPYLDELDEKAEIIGAVNTITIKNGKLKGYNTDYDGFKSSLIKWLGSKPLPEKAIILGTGGASKAVKAILDDLAIQNKFVSRKPIEGQLTYSELENSETFKTSHLIINASPLGMSPNTETLPELPYNQLTEEHLLFDLVYKPLLTAFMQKGIDKNCWVKNGLEMLHGQAEKAWEIWNK
jgi:shikimate dehydrogenase